MSTTHAGLEGHPAGYDRDDHFRLEVKAFKRLHEMA